MATKQPHTNAVAFQLKGSLFTLTVIHLATTDLAAITQQLQQLAQQTPHFFQHTPIVLDLNKIISTTCDFVQLTQEFRKLSLVPVGIRGGSAELQQQALAAGLAIMPNNKPEVSNNVVRAAASSNNTKATNLTAKVITTPVRSGQQIYARDCDLIVLAPVSVGAELIADGHIHVYNSLRGRALAGVNGNEKARIFCQSLEAELISIAGHYWINEDIQKSKIKNNVQVYLDNDHLHVKTF